jgi:hypothetical protein
MGTVLMGITFYHRQCLVAADPLDGREVDASLDKVSDRRVSEGMSNDLLRVESRGDNATNESLSHILGVAGPRGNRREEPGSTGRKRRDNVHK